MVFNTDLSQEVLKFSEEVILFRYPISYDANGDRIIETENPTKYRLRASVQEVEQDVSWDTDVVDLNESRTIYFPSPYQGIDGTKFNIQMRTRVTEEEDVPVDGVKYKSNNYDLVTKLADYPQYGYECFIIERIK